MFTAIAMGLAGIIAWAASRGNNTDRSEYERTRPDLWSITLHIRQDLKLVAFLLLGVIIMLGIVADRIH